MNSTSSPNSTNNSTIISESLKDRTLSLIKDENVDEKEILACSQDLMAIPNLDDDIVPITSPLLGMNSFEIFNKKKINPVFARNLLNIIHIINFIWIASKNKIDIFHKTLLNLGMMFSYLYRNDKDDKDGVDYALMAPIPNTIYDFIAKNGKGSFKDPNGFDFDEEVFSTDRNDTQVGYVYQENSISQILSNLNPEKLIICPKIIFYMEYKCAKELFNNNIFNNPANFLDLVHKEIVIENEQELEIGTDVEKEVENEIRKEKEFYGYNEIDMSFSLSETAKLKENFTFNIVKEKNKDFISKSYSKVDDGNIVFEKDANIFIEIKWNIKYTKIENILTQLKKISRRFSFGYRNSAYEPLDKKFSKDNNCYFLLYDSNRIDLFNKISPNLTIDKDVEICYNSVNVQLSSIISLQNQIREVKKESNSQNEKLNKFQEQINQLQEQIKKEKENNDYNLSIMNIKILHAREESIINLIKKSIETQSIGLFNAFKTYTTLFIKSIKLLEKIKPFEELITLNDNIIGKNEIDDNNYKTLIMLLENKIKEETFAKDYYIAYRNSLVGKIYKESNGEKCDFPVCNEEIAEILKNILKFIYLLDTDPMLLNSFFAAILYYVVAINRNDNTYSKLYFSKFKDSSIKDCVVYVIESLNSSYLTEFLLTN